MLIEQLIYFFFSFFQTQPALKYTSRKSRMEQYPNVKEEVTYIDGEEFIVPVIANNPSQRNYVQRLNRAIIKCDERVPHAFLTSAFIRVTNVNYMSITTVVSIESDIEFCFFSFSFL